MNIASSKLIWGHGGRFHGEEVSSPFSCGGGGGGEDRWGRLKPGCYKRKKIDFRSPEVGISACVFFAIHSVLNHGYLT